MPTKPSPKITWRKHNPTLTEIANQLQGEEAYILYKGRFVDPFDQQEYSFPGAVYVAEVDALGKQITIFLPECNVDWVVEPVAPYTVEIYSDETEPSLKIHEISEDDWPPHIQQWHEEYTGEEPLQEKPEALTRRELIDPILEQRGWTEDLIQRELTFTSAVDGSRNRIDYALYVRDERTRASVLAGILEAKHQYLPADYGLEQAKIYADGIHANLRFVFATNGKEFVQYDRLTKTTSAPFPLTKFPKPADLRKQLPLPTQMIDEPVVAGKVSIPKSSFDLSSAKEAGAVLRNLLSDDVRPACLELFGRAIIFAHQFGAGKWEVTLADSGRYIRLNVGRLEVGGLFQNLVHVILDDDTLTEKDRFVIGRYALLYGPTIYKSVASSVSCNFQPDKINIVTPLIWDSYRALILKASKTVKQRTSYYKSHASGVVQYIREVTQLPIPDPDYS